MVELIRALGVFCEPPKDEHIKLAEILGFSESPCSDIYQEIFCDNLPPYASIYTSNEGIVGGEALGRISGFWQALQRDVPHEPDHLSRLLGLAAFLQESQASEQEPARAVLIERSLAALFWEHLLPWLPMYLDRIESFGKGTVYDDWAKLLSETLICKFETLGPLENLPRHLDASSRLLDPRRSGATQFLSSLLAPVQSGFILLREDLNNISAEIGIPTEDRERQGILKDLLREEPKQTLEGLAKVAYERSYYTSERWGLLGSLCLHWERRAKESGELLHQLSCDLKEED